MESRQTKSIALSVALALPASLIGLPQTASALTLIESQQANASSPVSTSAAEHVGNAVQTTGRMIVKYREGSAQSINAAEARQSVMALSETTGVEMRLVRSIATQAQLIQFDESKSLAELNALAKEIEKDPGVLYAEPDVVMQAHAVPTDPRYNEQWHYFEKLGGMNLPEAWNQSTGKGIIVGVLDTGIRYHEDLKGQITKGYDFIFDPEFAVDGDGRDADPTDPGTWAEAGVCGSAANPSVWHGTHVAGTIAAKTNNGIGVAGVAWNTKILPVRVLGKCGRGSTADIAEAMRWAAGLPVKGVPDNPNPAKVLNLSLGGPGQCSQTFADAINDVRANGVTIVTSAGNNEGDDARFYQPANCPGVITVAATKRDGGRAGYSNKGSIIDVAAPGGQVYDSITDALTTIDGVLSTVNSGQTTPVSDDHYNFLQGTSMAAPHVAGTAALIYAVKPELPPDQVLGILQSTARPFPAHSDRPCDPTQCGTGIIDAAAAVQKAMSGEDMYPPPTGNAFENLNDVEIPDANASGAASVINVTQTGDSGKISVEVDIRHLNTSELYVLLTAPNGDYLVLENFGSSGANIQKTYPINAANTPAPGQWSLTVVDALAGNVGYIDAWRIIFK